MTRGIIFLDKFFFCFLDGQAADFPALHHFEMEVEFLDLLGVPSNEVKHTGVDGGVVELMLNEFTHLSLTFEFENVLHQYNDKNA